MDAYKLNYDGTIVVQKLFSARTPDGAKKSEYKFKIAGPGENTPSNTLYEEREITVNPNNDGMICRNLPYGEYTVTEIDGKVEGYTLTITAERNNQAITVVNGGITVTLDNSDHNKRFKFSNDYVLETGSISVKKTIKGVTDTSKLGDIEFTVEGPAAFNNGKVLTLTYPDNFDTNGVWSQDNVPTGKYTVTETKTGKSETYNCTSTKVNDVAGTSADLTLAKDGIIEFSFENTYEEIPQIGDLKVTKVVSGAPETTPKAFSFTIDLTYPASADLSQVTLDGTCSSKAFTDASKTQVTASIKNG